MIFVSIGSHIFLTGTKNYIFKNLFYEEITVFNTYTDIPDRMQ